jgi:hypothetical protein
MSNIIYFSEHRDAFQKIVPLVTEICLRAGLTEIMAAEVVVEYRVYTHATSRCKVSKENCAEILGIKLKPSYSKSIFYNDVDGCKLPCPTGRKLENQPSVTTSEK